MIRIEDDTNRSHGRIDGEQQNPAVLILASGLGSRLDKLTQSINKALLPINNKAIISHIIKQFPKHYDFIISTGYRSESLKDYCKIVFPDYNITFVDIDKIEGEGSGPGYSALQCKSFLQRPFYFTTCDCLIDSALPHLDGNWLGVYPTSFPEKYSTVKIDEKDNIIGYQNKNADGFDLAFIGLASIWDYTVFWGELEKNIVNGEVVCAFQDPLQYPAFKIKNLKWADTGNLDDLAKTRDYFKDNPLSLSKNTGEIVYKEDNRFLKFCPNQTILENRAKRAEILKAHIPANFSKTAKFISYDWENGQTLYEIDSVDVFKKFLSHFEYTIKIKYEGEIDHIANFYGKKTNDRLSQFIRKYDDSYLYSAHNINGKTHQPMAFLLEKIKFEQFASNPFYPLFHGDLQFDNIIYNAKTDKFVYIDWRESFDGYTDGGDIYYDLAKLYGGCLIPYNLMKDANAIKYTEGMFTISYDYEISENLRTFRPMYENWITFNGFDLKKVKLITALIFLNMSPLHDENFGKMLWFKSIEMLNTIYEGK